jgi:hypothetical protein
MVSLSILDDIRCVRLSLDHGFDKWSQGNGGNDARGHNLHHGKYPTIFGAFGQAFFPSRRVRVAAGQDRGGEKAIWS